MRDRRLITAASLAITVAAGSFMGTVAAGQSAAGASAYTVPKGTYTPPKTPWGDPDIQGLYDNLNQVPMQRPDNLAGKKTYTDAEMAARNARPAGNNDLCAPWKKNDDACRNASLARLDNVGGYNSFWSSLGW